MARNPVQFQKGMSLAAFQAEYGSEERCHAALRAQRWPDGFVCPKCQGQKHSYCVRRRLYQCSACRSREHGLGCCTIFEAVLQLDQPAFNRNRLKAEDHPRPRGRGLL